MFLCPTLCSITACLTLWQANSLEESPEDYSFSYSLLVRCSLFKVGSWNHTERQNNFWHWLHKSQLKNAVNHRTLNTLRILSVLLLKHNKTLPLQKLMDTDTTAGNIALPRFQGGNPEKQETLCSNKEYA